MKRKLYRELWNVRFKRMLQLEKKSVAEYQKMLAECRSHRVDHTVVPLLERLVRDETKHTDLVEELLQILERQPT